MHCMHNTFNLFYSLILVLIFLGVLVFWGGLKNERIEECAQFEIIDGAINQWRDRFRACVHTEGGHCEHMM